MSSSLNSAQIARYAARLQGQRLLPLLRGWQIRRAIRRLSLDGGPPALAALKDSADRGLLREERYRSLLEMVLFLEVDQPQAERIRALLWEAPQEEPATKPEDLPPSSPGEAGADPGVSALICDEQVADATPTPAGTLQPLQETRAADTPADAVRRAESGEPLPEAAADLAEEEQVPAPSDDHVQPEVGEEVASEQSGEPDDATEDSEEAPEDALPDEAHTEDDAVEKEPEASDLLATRGDTDDHEVRWDPLDDPDPPWVATWASRLSGCVVVGLAADVPCETATPGTPGLSFSNGSPGIQSSASIASNDCSLVSCSSVGRGSSSCSSSRSIHSSMLRSLWAIWAITSFRSSGSSWT